MAARIGVRSLTGAAAPLFLQVRHGHRLRGKAPGVAKTLEQRLAEERAVDPEVARKVNIGFPHVKPARSAQLKERLDHLRAQRANAELERLSRAQTLTVDPERVRSDWLKTSGPFHVQRLAEHYGIFRHLFGAAYFVPRVNLKVSFPNGEAASPVYYGNVIKPSEATHEPDVQFDPNFDFTGKSAKLGDTYWTLVLTNPDGHFTESDKEYCHWFVGNIPNGDVARGERIVPYLRPIPPKGTGFHRHVFVLYKQETKLDFGQFRVGAEGAEATDLAKRTFQTVEFYRRFQDEMTPAGLAFFQADWDQSLVGFYQDVLKLKHPVYEYDFPAPYVRDQEWFPLRRPFNLYMDKYRDPQQVSKEYLARKLAKTHPFEGPEAPLRFPNAHPVPRTVPSWLTTQIKKDRRGWGRVNDV